MCHILFSKGFFVRLSCIVREDKANPQMHNISLSAGSLLLMARLALCAGQLRLDGDRSAPLFASKRKNGN